MKASSIAVLKTLAYADIFDYPLTREEIWQWLISDKSKAEKTLQGLIKKGTIAQKEGYFFFKGREEVVGERKKKEEWAKEKWGIAQKTAGKLRKLPMIKLIGVTGALAMNNSQKEDDIDFLMVSSPNTLWLTRLLIFLLSPVLGVRRRKAGEKRVKNKICFNLFLDESQLKVGPENLFLAHEICQMKPLLNRDKTYERFLGENRWVKKYLPNAVPFPNNEALKQCNHRFFIVSLFNCLIAVLNKIAFFAQRQYMKPKMTIERVSFHQAFFHPQSLQDKVLSRYLDKIERPWI